MDRAEYRETLQRIRDLEKQGNYSLAADVIEGVNWKKVKSASTLCNVGTIMAKAGRYEESKKILLMAYDRASVGRSIVYELVLVALAENNVKEAEDYFAEYKEIAPNDSKRCALEYKLAQAQGKPIEDQIRILETLNEREFSEEWLFELAKLYHKAGDDENCVKTCDEIALYFGEGEYVARALELKAQHEPLTDAQKEQQKENDAMLKAEGQEASTGIIYGGKTIPAVKQNVGKYDTINLQAELAKGIQQIMDAKDTSTVESAMSQIRKAVKSSNLPIEEPKIESTVVFDGEKKKQLEEAAKAQTHADAQTKKVDLTGMLSEDEDGQVSMELPQQPQPQEQVEGQLTIDDMLKEWEKTRQAAEQQIEQVEQEELEENRAKALEEAENLINQVNLLNQQNAEQAEAAELTGADEQPEEQAAESENAKPQTVADDLGEIEPVGVPEEEESDERTESAGVQEVRETAAETQEVPEPEPVSGPEESQTEPKESASEEMAEDITVEPETEDTSVVGAEKTETEEGASEETDLAGIHPMQAEDDTEDDTQNAAGKPDDEVITDADLTASIDKDAVLRMLHEGISKVEAPEDQEEEPQEEAEEPEDEASSAINRMAAEQINAQRPKASDFLNSRIPDKKTLRQAAEEDQPLTHLTDAQKEVFTYFTAVDGMEAQIISIMDGVRRSRQEETSKKGNIIVTGEPHCGKTRLATDLIKVIQGSYPHSSKKVGKISAETLNEKDIRKIFDRIRGGYLIIEDAGKLNRSKAGELSEAMEGDTGGILVILEDTRKGISHLLQDNDELAEKFTEKIRIPIFTNDELVNFGKVYAGENGYTIDEMAILTLYERIGSIAKADRATSLEQVKEIVDDAITHSERGRLSRTMRSIFASRKEDEDDRILFEKDFQ